MPLTPAAPRLYTRGMKGRAAFLLLLTAGIASAQTRVAAPAEVPLAGAIGGGAVLAAPATLAPAALTLSASLSSPAGALSAPAAEPAAFAAAPAAAQAAAPALAAAASLDAAPAAAKAAAAEGQLPALAAASAAFAPVRGESPASGAAKAAAAFDGGRPLSVLMAASEAVPFIKTGGLADVVDAVSRGLAERGHRVMLVLPKFKQLKTDGVEFKPAGRVSVPIGDRTETAGLLTARVKGVDVVLLEHPGYYERARGPYDGVSAYGNDDNDERFAFYSRAALEAARALDFRPDVVHAHDWHAGLIPAYLKLVYGADPFFAATRSVVTIHNLAFQGVYPQASAVKVGFAAKDLGAMGPLEYWGSTSYLKAGLALADAVTTVSPTYAREIQSGSQFGMGMEGVLRARPDGVQGIINGLDPELNDPRTDEFLPRRYGAEDVAEGKAANKARLQERLGLQADPGAPLFAVASRLAEQKGIDLVLDAIHEIVARGAQVVVTGSGDKKLEELLAEAVARHPGRVASHKFDETFVHVVYAAADFLLMPSRFEPCGLSQLIAHRYGTLPIVTRTGGLADTVRDLRVDAERGDGIVMHGFSMLDLVEAVEAAIAGYAHPGALPAARATAMANDSSWAPPLDAYEALYRRITGTPSASRAENAAPGSADSASSTSSASDARRDGSTAP
jgi:starch synthase